MILDGWGRPLILQVPTTCSKCARIVSAGPIPGRDVQSNGFATALTDGNALSRGDDRVLFLNIPDPKAGGNTPCVE